MYYDIEDGSPIATFLVGFFEEGYIEIFAFKARLRYVFNVLNYKIILTFLFRYVPGDVLISFLGALAHCVSQWKIPNDCSSLNDGLTPGRIATVIFFSKSSLHLLKGKPFKWRNNTTFETYYK